MIATWKQHEGQAVDGIALLRLLGGGESSAVYLAERAGERCAIKLVPAEDVVAQLPLSRWEQASKLSHPHLTRILQWGRARLNGTPLVYVAMEYGEEELAGVDRPLTPKEAREMLTPAVKALAYLHGKGFAHGRIKPSNILSVQDQLKISGDAPLRKGERHASSTAPQPYDPPELATTGVTPAGDVWSLGVTLVEALTKELPAFDGGVLRLPDALKPDSFRDVATGCLDRDPARRWTIADIAQWLERGTVPAPKRAAARYLLPVAAVVAVAAMGAVVWTYGGSYFAGSQPAAQEPAAAPAVTPGVTPSPAASTPAAPPQQEPKPPNEAQPSKEAKRRKRCSRKQRLIHLPPPNPSPTRARGRISPSLSLRMSPLPTCFSRSSPTSPRRPAPPSTARCPSWCGFRPTRTARHQRHRSNPAGRAKYFADLALKAARQWKFVPGADAREWLLRFEFIHDAEHPVPPQVTSIR